jgi:porin
MNRTTTPFACLFTGLTLAFNPLFAAGPTGSSSSASSSTPTTATTTSPALTKQATPDDNGPVLPTTTTASPAAPEGLSDTGDKGFLDQDLMTGDWGGFRKTLEDDGVKFTPVLYGEVFGNPSGGASHGTVFDGLLDLNLDLDLDKMSDGTLSDTIIHADADYIYGSSLSENFIGDFSDTSNIAGYNSLRLQNLWIQKQLWEKRIAVKAGNISIDGPNEFFQSTSASLFINGTFGAFTFIAGNVPNAPVYPVASPGIQIQFLPTSAYYVQAGVFGMDANSDPEVNNKNGTRFALASRSGILIMSEAGYLLNQSPNDRGLTGTYRLGSFVHTMNYNNWGSQAANNLGTGVLQSSGTNYGVYAVMDQQIYANAEDRAISLFVRSGGAPSNVNFVDWYVEGGFNFNGFIPGRKDDIAGIAVARSHVSDNFSDSQIEQGNAPFTAETALEATYKVQLAPWWNVQPDFQYIVTPGGELGAHNATVVGLRTTVAF